jgi:hypothetical protein
VISLDDYYMGRDATYADELTDTLRANAARLLDRVNALLVDFGGTRNVTSGWRPKAVNAMTAGAALFSRHMTCEAIDLHDPLGDLDDWCMSPDGIAALAAIGLWLEHPAATKGWCHLQIVPPKSGRRVFYP